MPIRRLPIPRLGGLAVVFFAFWLTADAASATSRTAPGRELGGTPEVLDEARFSKWLGVLRREAERRRQRARACSGTDCELAVWDRLVRSLQDSGQGAQLDLVNRAINDLPYRSDLSAWGRVDHWLIPEDFLAGGGDCEDFAIAKYFALRELGFAADDLRVLVLRNTVKRIDHAVLVVHVKGRDLVLDVVRSSVVPWSELTHYRPLYSVNETSAWLHL